MSSVFLLSLLAWGLLLGLGAVWVKRSFQRAAEVPGEGAQQRILDEIDQLDLQIRIANERLKRLEDGMLLNPGEGKTAR
jgi:hypothetical protein